MRRTLFRRHIALTNEHGSWVFLLSPLLIGMFTAPGWRPESGWFAVAAVGGFLFRHPLTIAVKVYAGRRRRSDLPAAWFWMAVFGLAVLAGFAGLWQLGAGWMIVLALPALPILAWHLRLVARRSERRQIGMEIWAGGALALAAPGAYWAGSGTADPAGWLLWLLAWLQTAGSITHAAMRLDQRDWKHERPRRERLRGARRALIYTGFNLVFAFGLGLAGAAPGWIWIAFAIQFAESLRGAFVPAAGLPPAAIGLRQLAVSTLFTAAFILLWGI